MPEEDKSEDKLSIDDLDFDALDFEEEEIDEPIDEELDEEEEETPDSTDEIDDESDDKDEDEDTDDDNTDDDDSDDEDKDKKPDTDESEERIVDSVIKRLGVELTDEELESLEDTEEGLANLTEITSRKLAQKEFESIMETSPNAKAIYEYEAAGGNPEEFIRAFYPQTDYSKISIKDDDVDTQKAVIRESLQAKGLAKERIDRNMQAIEDSGNLLEEARDSLKDLQTAQQQRKEQIVEDTRKAREQSQKQAEKLWNDVQENIKKGELAGLPIPKAKQSEFEKFVEVNPETGLSPRDERISELSLEEQLAIDLVLFYGFDGLGKIIDTKASTKASRSLKDKIKSNKDRSSSSSQDPNLDKKHADVEDLEFRIG